MNILVPKQRGESFPVWMERSLREGGFFRRLLDAERSRQATRARLEAAALPHRHYQRKPGSEYDLLAVVDPRTYMRWRLQDPDFWHDKRNVQKFVQDNPVCAPWKG